MNCENALPPSPPAFEIENFIGDGKFEYIKNTDDRFMLQTAYQAVELTNNWDFICQDIDSFMWSNDSRINIIYNKIEELGYYGHSGCSFGFTMRNMQYLSRHGEEKFKELFIKTDK